MIITAEKAKSLTASSRFNCQKQVDIISKEIEARATDGYNSLVYYDAPKELVSKLRDSFCLAGFKVKNATNEDDKSIDISW